MVKLKRSSCLQAVRHFERSTLPLEIHKSPTFQFNSVKKLSNWQGPTKAYIWLQSSFIYKLSINVNITTTIFKKISSSKTSAI